MQRVIVILILFLFEYAWGSVCTGNTDNGINNPDGGSSNGQTNTYYKVCDGTFKFRCCGIINFWEYYAETLGDQVELIVWRPTGVGNNYDIAFTYTHTASGAKQQRFTPIGNYVVKEGDCLGWHSYGSEIIGYKGTGGKSVAAKYLAAASVNVGGTTDWTSGTTLTPYEWGLNARTSAPTSPTFPAQTSTYSISETTAVATSVAMVTFQDNDMADELTLTLTSATPSGYFTLDDNQDGTGTIKTHSTTSLSGASGRTVTLVFKATDLCGLTATGTFTINVINDPPKLLNLPISTDVGEDMLVQTTVATFICNDTSGSVTVGSSESPSNAPKPEFFFTKYVSGNVYAIVARAQTDPTMGQFDYNTQRFYDVTVRCSDSLVTVTDTIRANLVPNSPPAITNLPAGTSINVSQTTGMGTVVFSVAFKDADNDTVAFSLSCDPALCPFKVLDSGEVIVKESIEKYSSSGYDLFITPADGKNAGIMRTLSVKITDINDIPKFTNLNSNIVVDENTAVATTVFTVSFTDTDVTNTHTFFMTNPDGGTSYFDISPSGVITTKAAIDYESLPIKLFPFTIVISDGRASSTGTLTVTIGNINEPLTWNSATYRVDVPEQTAVGTTLTDPGFAITDPDLTDSYKCAMNCGASDGYFVMNSACKITASSKYSLDSGMASTVTCNVTAVDKGYHIAATTLIITILDADNYSPIFSSAIYSFTVSSQAGTDTAIGTVNATDADAGTYGQFAYSLNQTGLPRNYFKIDSTGLISTQVNMPEICNCSDVTYKVPVLATDTGGRVSTATVYITVLAVSTTTARTTTDRFKTFFEDTKNVVWFSLLLLLLAITAVVTGFVCFKYVCTGPSLCRNLFTERYWRPRLYDREILREASNRTELEYVSPKPEPHESVRRPPPPKAFQFWRNDPQFK